MEESKVKIVEDDSLMDKITQKVREAATRECPNIKYTGRHTYVATGEHDKETLKEVYRCMCGKEIL